MAGRVPTGTVVRGQRRPVDHQPGVGTEPDRDVPGPRAPDRCGELLLQPDQGVLLSAVRLGGQVSEGDQGPQTPGRPSGGRVQAPGTLQPAQPEAVRRAGPGFRVAREMTAFLLFFFEF